MKRAILKPICKRQAWTKLTLWKTDGTYLYALSDRQIVITKAYPAADMAVASKITFGNENISPNEMYIDGNTLIVIAGSYREVPYQYTDRDGNVQDSVRHESITLAMVYDISDRTNPSQVREFTVDGNYQTSRKIGDSFYLISQKWVYSDDSASPLPIYRDGTEEKAIGYDDMRCFPYSRENSMIMLAGITLLTRRRRPTCKAMWALLARCMFPRKTCTSPFPTMNMKNEPTPTGKAKSIPIKRFPALPPTFTSFPWTPGASPTWPLATWTARC